MGECGSCGAPNGCLLGECVGVDRYGALQRARGGVSSGGRDRSGARVRKANFLVGL